MAGGSTIVQSELDTLKYRLDEILTLYIEIILQTDVTGMSDGERRAFITRYNLREGETFKWRSDSRCFIEFTSATQALTFFKYVSNRRVEAGVVDSMIARDRDYTDGRISELDNGYYTKLIVDNAVSSGAIPPSEAAEKFKGISKAAKKLKEFIQYIRTIRNETRAHDVEFDALYVYNLSGAAYMLATMIVELFTREIPPDNEAVNYEKLQQIIELRDAIHEMMSDTITDPQLSEDNGVESVFHFKKTTYPILKGAVSTDPDVLATDLAENWEAGKRSIRFDREMFCRIMEDVIRDRDVYNRIREVISDAGKIVSDMDYMEIVHGIGGSLNGIYWKGEMLSESSFATRVLQIMTRHQFREGWQNRVGKVDTLYYRLTRTEEWNELSSSQVGVGINILQICKRGIISKYYAGKMAGEERKITSAVKAKDNADLENREELALVIEDCRASLRRYKKSLAAALRFEESVMAFVKQYEYSAREYADKIKADSSVPDKLQHAYINAMFKALGLIKAMKGFASYYDPNREVFLNWESFVASIQKKIRAAVQKDDESEKRAALEELKEYLRKVEWDQNFQWWTRNHD